MARPKGTTKTPSYRKHKRSGNAVVTIGGRDHYLGPHGSRESRAKYDRLIGEWLSAGRVIPGPGAAGKLTIDELIAAFWHQWSNKPRQSSSLGAYTYNVQDRAKRTLSIFRRLYGPTPAANFGPLAFRALLDEFKRTRNPKTGRLWTCATCNLNIRFVRQVFKWGVAQELIDPHRFHALLTVTTLKPGDGAIDTAPITTVEDSDVDEVLAIASPQMHTIISVLRLTGMRSGELAMMRPLDIDMSEPVWRYTPAIHKTQWRGKARLILIGPRAQELLLPWMPSNVADYVFKPGVAGSGGVRPLTPRQQVIWDAVQQHGGNQSAAARSLGVTSMTVNQAYAKAKAKLARVPGEVGTGKSPRTERTAQYVNERYDSHSLGLNMRKLCSRAAKIAAAGGRTFTPWHLHQLRHNAATEISKRYGMEVARITLGHSSQRTTAIYAEPDADRAAAAIREVG